MNSSKSTLAPVVLIVALATTWACACARTAPPPDVLRLAVSSPPEALDPRFATSAVATRLASLVAAPLFAIGDDLRPHPLLAASADHPDPLTWIVRLKPGQRFHDGAPVTARDVAFTLLSIKDPAVGSPHAAKLALVSDVVAVDNVTVRIALSAPYPPLLVDMNAYGILEERVCAPSPEACRMAPMGAGPFRVSRPLDDDERIELAADPAWPRDADAGAGTRIARIEVRVARDSTTRLLELEDGRVDLVVSDLSPADVAALAAAGSRGAGVVVERAPGLGYSYLALNVRGPRAGDAGEIALTRRALADARVRRALALALDVDGVIAAKYRGMAKRASGMLPDGHWAKDPSERALPFDPGEARRLLDDAGYPVRASAGAGSGRFHITLATTTDRLRRAISLVLADQWRAVGVDVDVVVRDWSALYEDIQQGAFDAFSAQWVPVLEPDLMHWVFASSSIPQRGRAGGNRSGYADAELDGWLDAARVTDDEGERAAFYRRASARVNAALPVVPLWFEDELCARSTRLEGFHLSPTLSLSSLASARLRSR